MGSKRERNRCYCGSGKKYKQCHGLELPPIPEVVLQNMREQAALQQARQAELEDRGFFIPLIPVKTLNGQRVYSTGNGLMIDGKEDTTFHELMMRALQATMGRKWWERERAKAFEDQHYLMQCYSKLNEFFTNPGDSVIFKDGKTGALPNGYVQSILNLAFDLHVLRLTLNKPPSRVIKRLRNTTSYQGAAYEITVASLFARIGCKLEYFNERTDNDKRNPEFRAILPLTGDVVVVEAKSKGRAGVLHLPGKLDKNAATEGKVLSVYRAAMKKDIGDVPYIVFIDVNAPNEVGTKAADSKWFKNVVDMVEKHNVPTVDSPDKCSAIFYTNWPYHYDPGSLAVGGGYAFSVPSHAVNPLPSGLDNVLIQRLDVAVKGHGFIPLLDETEEERSLAST